PVADSVFLGWVDFAEALAHPVGDKNRIVTKPSRSARRKPQLSPHFTFESLDLGAGRRQRQRANEAGRVILRFQFLQLAFHARDGAREVPVGAGPPRRMDSRRAA